jgi:tRNA-splicing ligase RtcB (3'-phosphate/5'-hydroxy nucleic acid ligase)
LARVISARAGINCALANRQILTDLKRRVFSHFFPEASLPVLFDVSYNTRKEEEHEIAGSRRRPVVRRKGATRAFGANHPELPSAFAATGQPVFIGGSMGTPSAIMVGPALRPEQAFASSCHGRQAFEPASGVKQWRCRQVVDELRERGIIIKSPSMRGVAEEAPGAYGQHGCRRGRAPRRFSHARLLRLSRLSASRAERVPSK